MQMEKFQGLGIWRGDAWEAHMGLAGLEARRKACGGSLAKCKQPRSAGSLLGWLAVAGGIAGVLVAAYRWAARHYGGASLLPTSTRTGR